MAKRKTSRKPRQRRLAKLRKPRVKSSNGAIPALTRTAQGITNAAIAAAIEVGRAAQRFQSTMQHAARARAHGGRALRPIRRAGRRAVRTVRNTISGARR